MSFKGFPSKSKFSLKGYISIPDLNFADHFCLVKSMHYCVPKGSGLSRVQLQPTASRL